MEKKTARESNQQSVPLLSFISFLTYISYEVSEPELQDEYFTKEQHMGVQVSVRGVKKI